MSQDQDAKLKALFKQPQYKSLFQKINPADYEGNPEGLYCDGECGVIKIGRFHYRYRHEDSRSILGVGASNEYRA